MKFLHEYIEEFKGSTDTDRIELGNFLQATKNTYDIHLGGNARSAFEQFVARYNWLGQPANKQKYVINQNLARNLPGALMQDYLIHLVIQLCEPYPQLDIFTEVRVPFGRYPLWKSGIVRLQSPSEHSDLAVGYLVENGETQIVNAPWPKYPFYRLEKQQSVIPLVTINSKIRVSQSEFFDWLGREQLMTKGNPHCLSIQIALRKEMDLSIVEAAQAGSKFFLLGEGNEGSVTPLHDKMLRFAETFNSHLAKRMQ